MNFLWGQQMFKFAKQNHNDRRTCCRDADPHQRFPGRAHQSMADLRHHDLESEMPKNIDPSRVLNQRKSDFSDLD